jgi:hypothetical protein
MSDVDRAYRAKVWRAILMAITGFWFILGALAIAAVAGILWR